MIKNVYSVRDVKSGYSSSLITAVSDDVAKRDFKIFVNTPGSLVHAVPEDFELYKIGKFDEDSGCLTCDSLEFCARASDMKEV